MQKIEKWLIILKTAFLFILVQFPAMAQTTEKNGHGLSLGASIGFLIGEAEEIVYRNGSTDGKKSQLLWQVMPLVYAGVDLHYNWRKPANKFGIFADALFKFGIPGKSGEMEDRDWLNNQYPGWLTHYSVHDNKTKTAIILDVNAGMSFTVFEQFLLKPFISYSFMYFSWSASGGSFLYPQPPLPLPHGNYYDPDSTVGITYKQTWHIASPGIAFYGGFNRYFDIDLFLKLSPLVWCTAIDDHVLRNTAFTDTMFGGLFFEAASSLSFKPNDFFTLSLFTSYRRISGTRGNTIEDEQGYPLRSSKNQAGTGYSVFDVGITAKFKLF